MTELEQLVATEAIKQVKAKYFYAFDHKDWEMWRREVWTPDGRLEVPEFREEPFTPFEEVLAYASASAADQVSVHHGHMPIIAFTSDTTANVVWAMEDWLFRTSEHPLYDGSTRLHGFGHYYETYVKVAAGWRIQSSRLTRLRVEMTKVL